MRFLLVLAAAAALTSPALAQSSSMSNMSNMSMPTCKAGNPVVWLNTDSNVYFKRSSKYYGHTKNGKYVCRNTAVSMGAHKAKHGMKGHHMDMDSMASPDAMSH